MEKQKKINITIGLLIVVVAIILSHTYRIYIYENYIFDFHIADTIGNLLGLPAALFFLSGIRKGVTEIKKSIPIIVFALVLFEFMGLIGLHGIFDICDIIAAIISGLITYLVLFYFFHITEL